ncbi:C-type lectin domain family 4 member F-like [Seriola aureovittata]|uniref:C-type lectin domain family 4 member F-like n=1 Tax=Seriola aureovittata TaxID=2871759 RepID=UPI0024BD938C|nr:C-type lectin domain family 4 member F-like [Seriola aureovittata]
MANGVHTEEFELTMEDENLCAGSAKSEASLNRSGEEDEVTSVVSGRKLWRLVVVSFALLCILQAIFSISLRIAFRNEAGFKNLTKQRDELKRINSDIEGRYKSLTEERDELKRINFAIEANSENLTEERDALKKINSDIVASFKNLTEERDELKRINFDTEASRKNLTEQRDELERKLNISDSQCHSLTEESDKLKKRLKNGWLYFSGSFYYISSNEKTWQESRKDCIQKGADLTIINNREEQNFIRQFKKYLWIGLTDIETEGKWKWVDGTPLTRSFWDSKEPNGKTLENCGQIKNPNLQNNWNDERCSNTHNWICEEKGSL